MMVISPETISLMGQQRGWGWSLRQIAVYHGLQIDMVQQLVEPDALMVQVPTFASQLRRFRDRRGWSMLHLARRTAIDVSLIWRFEHGERLPSRATLRRLASALCESDAEVSAFVVAGVLGDHGKLARTGGAS